MFSTHYPTEYIVPYTNLTVLVRTKALPVLLQALKGSLHEQCSSFLFVQIPVEGFPVSLPNNSFDFVPKTQLLWVQ